MEQGTNKKYIGVHAMILQMKDLKRVHERIESLEESYKEYKAPTVESYGLVHFVDEGAKIEGELKNKYPDMRIVEVNSTGVEATPVSHEVPKHPFQLKRQEHLPVVLAGLIRVQNLRQAIDFGQKECDKKEELRMVYHRARNLKFPLRNDLQHLVGMGCHVTLNPNAIVFTKYPKFILFKGHDQVLSWDWPKRYVTFVATRKQSPSAAFMNINTKLASREVFTTTHCHAGAGFVQQFVTADQVEPDAIEKAFRYDGGSVSNFGFSDKPLEWNHFRGFRFIFSIRELQSSAVETAEFMENFKRKGYLNYYNVDPIDLDPRGAVIGYSLIRQLFVDAATHFVSPNPTGIPDFEWINAYLYVCENGHPIAPYIHEALQDKGVKRWTHRRKLIYKHLPLNIYKTLEKFGELDAESAKEAFVKTPAREIIHFTDLFLYKMWNETVNLLIEKRGLKLAVGDLVFVSKEMEEYVNTTQGPSADNSYLIENSYLYESVKVLTQEDLSSGAYTIKDLVIPVCGCCVRWPQNDCGGFIEEVLKKYTFENMEWFSQLKNKSSSLPVIFPGTYRRVINVPENLKWKIREYIDPKVPLVLDDVPLQPLINDMKDSDGNAVEPETKNALIVEFFVPARTNLMTPLREILKKNDFGDLARPFNDNTIDKCYKNKFQKSFNDLKVRLKEAIDKPKTHLGNADYIQLTPETQGPPKRIKLDQPDLLGQRYYCGDLTEFHSINSVADDDDKPSWMTDDLYLERGHVIKLRNRYLKGKESLEVLKRARNIYKRNVKIAKQNHFKQVLVDFESVPSPPEAKKDLPKVDKSESSPEEAAIDPRLVEKKCIQPVKREKSPVPDQESDNFWYYDTDSQRFWSDEPLFGPRNSQWAQSSSTQPSWNHSTNRTSESTNQNCLGNYGRQYYGSYNQDTSNRRHHEHFYEQGSSSHNQESLNRNRGYFDEQRGHFGAPSQRNNRYNPDRFRKRNNY